MMAQAAKCLTNRSTGAGIAKSAGREVNSPQPMPTPAAQRLASKMDTLWCEPSPDKAWALSVYRVAVRSFTGQRERRHRQAVCN
jgi:hypothetical protein